MENSQRPTKKQRTAGGLGHPTSTGEEIDPTLKKKNPNTKKKKTNEVKPITESAQFKEKNYRGALQEYFQKKGDVTLSFETELKSENETPLTFICTCKAGKVTAKGEAQSKKRALQAAALAVIKKMERVPSSKKKQPKKVPVVKKTKEELLEEREFDTEENIYTGTVKFYRMGANFGFISIDEEITFKGVTAKERVYVMKGDIVCSSDEVGLTKDANVSFKIYKDSLGVGACEVQNEDGTPIVFERKAEEEKSEAAKSPKKKEKIIENKQYLNGNFRGALQEYLVKQHPGVTPVFETELQQAVSRSPVYIATCKSVNGTTKKLKELVGTGHAAAKKGAIHLSALDFMLKLNLLTAAQHFKVHHSKKE